jgi:hypothetical protein
MRRRAWPRCVSAAAWAWRWQLSVRNFCSEVGVTRNECRTRQSETPEHLPPGKTQGGSNNKD